MVGRKILIVEDEGLIALHLIEVLENDGYDVAEPVSSGEKALNALETSPLPALILMDVGLSGSSDGIRTAEIIRLRFPVPVIFVTAFSSEGALERMRATDPAGIIIKPFKPEELLELVGKVVGRPSG